MNSYTRKRCREEAEQDSDNDQQALSREGLSGKSQRGSRRGLVLLECQSKTRYVPMP